METGGIDAVCSVKDDLITEVLNRIGICKLAPVYLPPISLRPSTTQGEILVTCLGIDLAVRTEISAGKLRLYVEPRSEPGGVTDMLAPLLNASPYEVSLQPFEVVAHPVQTGLKVGGSGNHNVLFGIHFSEGTGNNWDYFYNSYQGSDLIGTDTQWGVALNRQIASAAINRVAEQALANVNDLAGMDVSNTNLEQITWPGEDVRLKGTGTYDMSCSLGGSTDIDVRWEAAVTLVAEGSKLSANLRLTDASPRGEEDAIKAFFCSLSIEDLILGLFTAFTNLLVKIISALVSDSGDRSFTKELIDLAIPETGALRITSPVISTDGISIQGQNAYERGASAISVPAELVLFSDVHSPFYSLRPTTPLIRDLVIGNPGGASLTVCSAEFSGGGLGPLVGRWGIQNCCATARIALPGGETSLTVTFEPLSAAEYDHDYTDTLTLNMVTKTVDSAGACSYGWESRTVQVKARYEFQHYDGVYEKPWIGVGLQPDEIYIEAGLDHLVDSIIPDMPWVDIPIPDDGLQIFDFSTPDPAVASVQVFDAQNILVSDVGKSFPEVYVSLAVGKGQVLSCKAVGVETGPAPGPVPAPSRETKTVLKCKKRVLLPAGSVTLASPIAQASLDGNRLLIAAGREFLIYDVSDPAGPARIGASKMPANLVSFAISPEPRTRGGGFLQVCMSATQLMSYELAGLRGNSPSLTRRTKQAASLALRNPVRVLMQGPLCLVAAAGGVSLYDFCDVEQPRLIGGITCNSKVRDALWIRQNLFLATDRGVEVLSVRKPSKPERVNIIATSRPVTSLQTDGLYLYANLAPDPRVAKDEGRTLAINLLDLKAAKPVGQYSKPIWRAALTTAGDLAFAISKDRTQLKLFTWQAATAQKPHAIGMSAAAGVR